MYKRITLIAMMLVIGTLSLAAAQQQQGADVAEQKKAASQEREKKLRKLNLEIATVGDDYSTPRTKYYANEEVPIRVGIVNTGDEPMVVVARERYEQFFPRLMKDGQPVPYSQKAKERLADTGTPLRRNSMPVKLEPHAEGSLGLLFLRDWYGELEPGVYQLTVRFGLERTDRKIKTNTVTFEVVPQ